MYSSRMLFRTSTTFSGIKLSLSMPDRYGTVMESASYKQPRFVRRGSCIARFRV